MKRAVGAILAAVLVASCSAGVAAPRDGASEPPAPSATPQVGEQRQDEAGMVTVTVSWVVGTTTALVGMNTHSVDLDGFDLMTLARVRLDGGPWTAPTSWDAPAGGHHRAGDLTFGTIEPAMFAAAAVVELEIRDVAVPLRVLRWERQR